MSIEQVTVPDIGGAEGAEVIELLIAVGDEVSVEQGLIVLESDKASMEIPSTVSGKVVEVLVSEGDQLAEGSPVVRVETSGDADEAQSEQNAQAAAPADEVAVPEQRAEPEGVEVSSEADPDESAAQAPASAEPPEPAEQTLDAPASLVEASGESKGVYAGPAVRKLSREFGIPLDQVTGTGPQGRVLKEDLHAFSQKAYSDKTGAASGAGIPAVPEVDFAKFGAVDVQARSKLDRLTATNMHRSWLNVPHVTQMDEADITALEEFRQGLKPEAASRGVKVSPLPFVIKACALALRDNPQLNASLSDSGAQIVYKQYFHIGMAVDTPAGLVVPVIRDVDQKSIWELAQEIAELAERARERKLSPADMQGGCFTVSSLGSIGGQGFTPIVNTPEVGILGVSNAQVKPLWTGDGFEPRTMLPLSLSYDHRVVNGGHGGRFLTRVVALLSDIREFVM